MFEYAAKSVPRTLTLFLTGMTESSHQSRLSCRHVPWYGMVRVPLLCITSCALVIFNRSVLYSFKRPISREGYVGVWL